MVLRLIQKNTAVKESDAFLGDTTTKSLWSSVCAQVRTVKHLSGRPHNLDLGTHLSVRYAQLHNYTFIFYFF